jgi:hypothetical protein
VLARDWQKIKKTEAAKRMGSGLKHPPQRDHAVIPLSPHRKMPLNLKASLPRQWSFFFVSGCFTMVQLKPTFVSPMFHHG